MQSQIFCQYCPSVNFYSLTLRCIDLSQVFILYRAWAININSEGPNLHQPLPPHLAQFDPIFADDHSLFSCAVDGVSVAAEPPNPKGCPKELGDVLSGMKENGQRLLVLPSTSKLARTLCEGRGKEAEKACRPGWAIMLSVQGTYRAVCVFFS